MFQKMKNWRDNFEIHSLEEMAVTMVWNHGRVSLPSASLCILHILFVSNDVTEFPQLPFTSAPHVCSLPFSEITRLALTCILWGYYHYLFNKMK